MKIIHKASGKAYELSPETKLEMTRTNPFFHKKGEQSLPITLPPSDHNAALLGGSPSVLIRSTRRDINRQDAIISAGVFQAPARQAILSANPKEGYATTFYLNEGSFFEKTKNLMLPDIFGHFDTIHFNSIENGIESMLKILNGSPDERLACFPIRADFNGMPVWINRVQYHSKKKEKVFFNASKRVLKDSSGRSIYIPSGYFITPFIRFKFLMNRVFRHLGYSLEPSFLDSLPLDKVVFLNANVDTIMDADLRFSEITPNISVAEFLDIIRIKFNAEFIPNETNKTLQVVAFNDILENIPAIDIGSVVVDKPALKAMPGYKQIRLSTDVVMSRNESSKDKSPMSSKIERAKAPFIRYSEANVVSFGFEGHKTTTKTVASLQGDFFSKEQFPFEDKKSPDTQPLLEIASIPTVHAVKKKKIPKLSGYNDITTLYVGEARTVMSSIVFDTEKEDSSEKEKTAAFPAMLSLYYHDKHNGFSLGTLSSHDREGSKLWDFSLLNNGPYGLFELFWRKFDDLLRNSLMEVELKLLLSENDKLSFPSYSRFHLDGSDLLLSEMKYVPGMMEKSSCSFFTTSLLSPISSDLSDLLFVEPKYVWEKKVKSTEDIGIRWDVEYIDEPSPIFPPLPTERQYLKGGKFYERSYEVLFNSTNGLVKDKKGTVEVWLEVKKMP